MKRKVKTEDSTDLLSIIGESHKKEKGKGGIIKD
jgi:hypothetical protein